MINWQDSVVMITGVCGTVGRELLRQVAEKTPRRIIGVDNNESELFFLTQEYRSVDNVLVFLCDLRDRDELSRKMKDVDIVLHSAALKHVILCEESPRDAVQTNIFGTQNVIDAAHENGVGHVLFTSSDKAVNPTNVMGTSKLMGERLITAANAHRRAGDPVFSSTRFGNVLGSRGSVIPLFRRQIKNGGPVTLTDEQMTRFIMTLREAVRLVMHSVELARGGEVFVTKMPVVKISDLAEVMIEELAESYGHRPDSIAIEKIGPKSGEKMYEELMNIEETRRTLEMERFFVVLPAFKNLFEEIQYEYEGVIAEQVDNPFNSAVEPCMDKGELRSYLSKNGLLTEEAE